MAYSVESDVTSDGFKKLTSHDGTIRYEKCIGETKIEVSVSSTGAAAAAAEKVRAFRTAKGLSA